MSGCYDKDEAVMFGRVAKKCKFPDFIRVEVCLFQYYWFTVATTMCRVCIFSGENFLFMF